MSMRITALCASAAAGLLCAAWSGAPYRAWERGPSASESFFPIGVWLQNPARAAVYRRGGFNLYIGLWKGPTEAQLEALRKAGMRTVCAQNEVGLRHRSDPTIAGWMHGDEPDNAQPLPGGKGYGPPIPPEKVVADYRRMRRADPSRPVLLNLGQGVAWDGWYGRGPRSRHPEDYPKYIQGCDIVSFDIYPAAHRSPEVAGKLWRVARGVERLRRWSQGKKIVWNCIECTRISNPDARPTPRQVRAEVWMSLIHGSQGLIYFVHEWVPRFTESGLLENLSMWRAVTNINWRIRRLAPALNSPTLPDAAEIETVPAGGKVAWMTKQWRGRLYVFAVEMEGRPVQAAFRFPKGPKEGRITVLGENREVRLAGGRFSDRFAPWDVHLYSVPCGGSGEENPFEQNVRENER
ncbi:MAG: hypothetical protein J7M29_10460 [Verrucomicrobia bacterium]|nr:hypothetical protein [Verrucomicrobiota bacterium]